MSTGMRTYEGCEVQQGKDEVKAGFSEVHGTSFDSRWTQS